MNLQATIELHAYGTSDGARKAWDTRGRSTSKPETVGKIVRRFTKSNASYQILDSAKAGDDWAHGGCWMLADAIQKKFGGELVAVSDEGVVQHIATKIGGKYIDAYGAYTKEALLSRLRSEDGLKNPTIGSLQPASVPSDIPKPQKQDEIVSRFGV